MDRTADEARADHVRAMGRELGELYAALWQEVAWVHSKWAEYVVLFGTKESRVQLLNRAAPQFARFIQDSLWEDVLLHVARLTDPPRSMGRQNLSIQSLPDLIDDLETKRHVAQLVEKALLASEFCRDWRNRHLAHRDLLLALARGAEPLKAASRQSVCEALRALAATLNAIAGHYLGSTSQFETETGAGGALSLLHVIDDGLKAERAKYERLKSGRVEPNDYMPKDL